MAYPRYTQQHIGRYDFACACDQIVLKYISCSGTFHECHNLKIITIYITKKDGGRVSFSNPKNKLVKRFYNPSLFPLVGGGGV